MNPKQTTKWATKAVTDRKKMRFMVCVQHLLLTLKALLKFCIKKYANDAATIRNQTMLWNSCKSMHMKC